jgi:cytosine/adenosine deaminase-related metal-dependent hydrolase
MTIDAAFLGFEEDIKGSIEPGKLADLVVLTDNPLDMPPDKIDDVEIDYTIIGGDIVYDRARDGGSRKDERHARDPNRETAYGDGGGSFDL